MITTAARTVTHSRARGLAWTADESEYLAAHFAADGPETIGHRLGRSTAAVLEQAKRLGLYIPAPRPTPKPYTYNDLATLRRLYPAFGPARTAQLMHRDPRNVKRKAEALGLTMPTADSERKAREAAAKWEAIAAAEAAAIRDPEPTDAKPGTLDKIRVMQQRAAAGCWLFHIDDAPIAIDNPAERAPAEPAAADDDDF